MASRLLTTDIQRIRTRDNKLWVRDQRRAALYNFHRIPCPCAYHKGTGRPIGIEEVRKHLIRYGRSPNCRTWRGPDNPDSSDEEWEEEFSRRVRERAQQDQNRDSGLQMRDMMRDIYQQVESFTATEEQIDEITLEALETVDNITGTNNLSEENSIGNQAHSGDEDRRIPNDADPGPSAEDGDERRYNHMPEGATVNETPGNVNFSGLDERRIEEERIKDAKALEDAMCLLYPGSKHTKLGATVMMVNLVATHPGLTEKAADDLLATVQCLLPQDNCLPSSLYQAKTLTKRLGLDFKNIHGCPTGCTLFDEDHTKNLERCPVCGANRYRDMLNKTRPVKVLRQFPVTPRLQRFYRIPVLSKLLRWYSENRSQDGKVRYPADTMAWKKLDTMDPTVFDTAGFGSAVQDVRLQVSCDGICPFKLHKSTWSAWPVLVSFLNLPPWLITKNFFTILTLLIPGRSQVPFEFFNVWMRPLVDELKELWKGVPSYDVIGTEENHSFNLRAAVLWTTHDFPGYGTVSGASHQGYAACPPCGNQMRGKYAYESKKLTYRDARRWLKPDHILRSPEFNHLFNGESENRQPPKAKTPAEQCEALREYQEFQTRPKRSRRNQAAVHVEAHDAATTSENGSNQRRSRSQRRTSQSSVRAGRRSTRAITPDPSKIHGMKRESTFSELPYWEHLQIRNTLDLMHCEKNFAENLLKTICGYKEKDSVRVRRDMQREEIRPHLWMVRDPNNASRMLKPVPNYVLSPREFNIFCTRLENLRVPSDYCSDIGSHIRNRKFSALKSHDYHILMQTLIPLALRGLMDRTTRTAIMRACRVFRRLCCKVWDPAQAEDLREDVAVTMCLMEIAFPPTFFDIMSHLPMHLVEELIVLGPPQVRWMYPVERTMQTLKNHVKNRARPEASIAHGYLLDETMGFATSYMHGFDVVRRRVWDADPEDSAEFEVLEGAPSDVTLSRAERDAAHRYVLRNNTLTASYYSEWEEQIHNNGSRVESVESYVKRRIHSEKLDMADPDHHDTVLLSNTPSLTCKRYARMTAYGNHWRVDDDISKTMKTFDSGVACFEANPQSMGAGKDYVGILQDIIVLDYGKLKTPATLFSCQWKRRNDNHGNNTYVRDEDGFLVVNFKHNTSRSIEPYVFPSQCTQVFFADDDRHPRGSEWKVILRKEARSRRKVEEDDDIFISTTMGDSGGVARETFRNYSSEPDLAGAIVLTDAENAVALQSFDVLRSTLHVVRKRKGNTAGNQRKRRTQQ